MSGQAPIVIVGGGIAFQLAGAGSGTRLAFARVPLPAGQDHPHRRRCGWAAEDFWAYATTRFARCKQLMGSATFATHLTAVSRSRAAP